MDITPEYLQVKAETPVTRWENFPECDESHSFAVIPTVNLFAAFGAHMLMVLDPNPSQP